MTAKKEGVASNPTIFGFAGFAIALMLLGFHYVRVIELNSVVLSVTLIMGFFAPFLAGVFESIKGNTFRTTIFILFSLFFLTLFLFATQTFGLTIINGNSQGIFFIAWTVVALIMLAGTFGKEMDVKMIILQVILGLFALFTLILAIALFTLVEGIFITAGVFALICSAMIFINFIYHMCIEMMNN